MIQKAGLYFNTIRYMKASQVYYRLKKKAGFRCTAGYIPPEKYSEIQIISVPKELDFDSVFIGRFDADQLVSDIVTFLHSSAKFYWDEKWEMEDQSPLWNFNLHYFEYLFSLLNAYKTSGKECYLEKANHCIQSWITHNPVGKGSAWSAYTISLRLTNWIGYYIEAETELSDDFKEEMLTSMYQQYRYLSMHMEKDILGNHYFENLKTLVLGALFFKDANMLKYVLTLFKKECCEQILPDGMHFELSPMYHKIILEDMIRVAVALKGAGYRDAEIENLIEKMLDVAWSFEAGLDRIPLFNDGGNNVAKSLDAIVVVCDKYLGIKPHMKTVFPQSGYYMFEWNNWKMIIDAGVPGPSYIPGHAHCDALSFELFHEGKPVIVNCGTYAYQCKERAFFRSTQAHNTVLLNNVEQSQCWSVFRLAKRSKTKVLFVDNSSICMQMIDQNRQTVERTISVSDHEIRILDCSKSEMKSYIHVSDPCIKVKSTSNQVQEIDMDYAEEYGKIGTVKTYCMKGRDILDVSIIL